MGFTNFANGVSSLGIPVIPGQTEVSTGSVFFVGNASGSHASNGNSGVGAAAAYSTLAYAISQCTAGKFDTIYVMPGHAETITSLAVNVAGVRIIGLGQGLNRPTFTFGAAASTITVSAANCSWSNCHFIANFADVAAAFTLSTAKDFKLDNCTFVDTSSILNFLSIVVTGTTDNAADGLSVTRNYSHGLAATANAFVSVLGDLNRLWLADNHVDKAATNDAGQFLTITADTVIGARIMRNILVVVGATGSTVGIFITGSSTDNTGIVAYNLVASLDTTTELIATAGTKLKFFENYYTGTADASGKLWPVVDAA